MRREEFIERTGYTPEVRYKADGKNIEFDEYTYIEQSYYDSGCVNKDEFCKEWKERYEAGFWSRELELLQKIAIKDEEIRHDYKLFQVQNDKIKMLEQKAERNLTWAVDLNAKYLEVKNTLEAVKKALEA